MATYSEVVSATGPMFTPPAKMTAVLSQIVTIGTADLTQNTTFDIGYIPANCRVIDAVMAGTDMDSAGAPAMIMALGDTVDADRWINGSTVGQTAAVARAGNNATSAKTMAEHAGYTAPTKQIATVITAPGTAVAGTLTVSVLYEKLEPPTAT